MRVKYLLTIILTMLGSAYCMSRAVDRASHDLALFQSTAALGRWKSNNNKDQVEASVRTSQQRSTPKAVDHASRSFSSSKRRYALSLLSRHNSNDNIDDNPVKRNVPERETRQIFSRIRVQWSISSRATKKKKVDPLVLFGSLYKEFGSTVNKITGKQTEYEFGDLTRWILENQATGPVQAQKMSRPGTEHHDEAKSKSGNHLIPGFFGALVRVLLIHAIRIILKFGWERQAVSGLPTSVLMDIARNCLHEQARPRVLSVVAQELEHRLKLAIAGDENYEFGDLTKDAVHKFTGKSLYQFGDITKTILQKARITSREENKRANRHNAMVADELKFLEHLSDL
jgi:hypothetical protein